MANQEATEDADVLVTMAAYNLPVPERMVCTGDTFMAKIASLWT